MSNVALFFGSFNPIHNGHIHIAKKVLEKKIADKIEFVISPKNPFKDSKNLIPIQERLMFLKKCIKMYRNMEVNEIELEMPLPNYTSDTIKKLTGLNPKINYSILVGADTAKSLNLWKDFDFLKKFKILIYPRKGVKVPNKNFWKIIPGVDFQEISSTQIRKSNDINFLKKNVTVEYLNYRFGSK